MRTPYCRFVKLVLLINALLLGACVATEPARNTPHINLSPEDMPLPILSGNGTGPDFGMNLTFNESDSLENLEVLPGVRVRSINANGPAAMAGLQAGDVILSINGIETNSPDVVATLAQTSDNDKFSFTVRRGTTVFETTIPRPERVTQYAPEERYRVEPIKIRAGFQTDTVSDANGRTRTVARIAALFPESPLEQSGISIGDTIVAFNGNPITSAQALVNTVSDETDFGDKVRLSILPNNVAAGQQAHDVEIHLWDPGRRVSKFSLWPLFTYGSNLQPAETKFTLLDLFGISLFSFQQKNDEKEFSVFTIFRFATGYGELTEVSTETATTP
jgi:serine protease Do